MENKTVILELTEAEADHLWHFLADLRANHKFKDGRDLKLVTTIHKKLKDAAKFKD